MARPLLSADQRYTLRKWFEDPDTGVAVYENVDLSDRDLGERFALPYTLENFRGLKLGDRAPDTKQRLGWRYVLKAKCENFDEVVRALDRLDEEEGARS